MKTSLIAQHQNAATYAFYSWTFRVFLKELGFKQESVLFLASSAPKTVYRYA